MDGSDISREEIEFAGLQRVNYSKLPREEKLTIMWSWFLRTFLVTFGCSGILGLFYFTVIMIISIARVDLDPRVLGTIFLVLSLPLGLLTVHPLIHWMLSSRIGNYRILLCKKRENEDITLGEQEERRTVAF